MHCVCIAFHINNVIIQLNIKNEGETKLAMKIAVGGCRDFNDSEYIFKCLDEYIKELCDVEIIIISGHCSGVDSIAKKMQRSRVLRL